MKWEEMSRGTKRDFIDLYFVIRKFGANQVFAFYNQKYGNLEDRELMLKKALIYFSEADQDEMPNMVGPLSWEAVKEFFLKTFF